MPNTADFNFNYYHLLEINKNQSIGCNNDPQIKVAIIGAGIAGLTAARELFRCGYTNIDIYEASHRIGGRTYSRLVEGQHTVLEMGAMRMPFSPLLAAATVY
ncbi:FAD-dependent oxidoreductase [Microcoleus sp. S36b_A3]|uniref:FAD-dependent oxidoreductase n=1 Tax=unclassified Microcoleus TaxID=2642155 RepID=UPI002FD302AD